MCHTGNPLSHKLHRVYPLHPNGTTRKDVALFVSVVGTPKTYIRYTLYHQCVCAATAAMIGVEKRRGSLLVIPYVYSILAYVGCC
eukprot:SAG11_NODE_2502_length_3279_cov_1.547627_5_plen_85_part_00